MQSRYYDPEVGRFISQDSIEYADPETINGLNLYAYCGNNPVMNVDPTGEFFWSFLIAVIVGAVIGGVIGGINAERIGDNFWGGFLSGALVGGVLGGAMILGGATMLAVAGKAVAGFITVTSFAAKATLLVTTFVGSTLVSAGVGAGAYALQEAMNGRDADPSETLRQGIMTGIKGAAAYITGMVLASTGAYNYLIKGVNLLPTEKISMTIARSAASFILQFPWKIGLK